MLVGEQEGRSWVDEPGSEWGRWGGGSIRGLGRGPAGRLAGPGARAAAVIRGVLFNGDCMWEAR